MIDLVQYRTSIGLFASVTSKSSKKKNTKLPFKTVKKSSKPTTKIKNKTKDEDVTRGRSFICLQLLTVVLCLHVVCSNQFLDTNTFKHSDICDSRCTGTEILHCNVYGSVKCWEILGYGDVGSYNNNILSVNYNDTKSNSDASISHRENVNNNDTSTDFHGNRSEPQLPSDICFEHSYFIHQSIGSGTVMIQSLEMCPYPGTCCYLLGNKGMHCYNGNPPTGRLYSTEEMKRKQRLCVLLVDGGSQALRYTISRIVLKIKLQNVDGQTRGKLCVSDKSLLYPAGSVLSSLDGLSQAGLNMVWTKALQQSPVTSATAQNMKDMIYNYLVSDGLDIQLKNNKQRVQELNNEKRLLSKEQWDILYPRLNATVDLESFDMTLLCFVILNVFQFKPTSGIWSQDPPAGDVGVGDDILRLRTWRNKLTPSSSSGIDNSTFKTAWTEIRDILLRLKPGQEFSDKIQHLHDCQVDPGNAAKYDQLIEDWISHDTQLGKVESDMSQIQECLTETRKEISEHAAAPQESSGLHDTESQELSGQLAESQELSGQLAESQELSGQLAKSQELSGQLAESQELSGQLEESQELSGQLAESQELLGQLAESQELSGQLAESQELSGQIAESQELSGQLAESQELSGQLAESQELSGQLAESQELSGQLAESQELLGQLAESQELSGQLGLVPQGSVGQDSSQQENQAGTIATSVSEVEGIVAAVQIRQSENPGTPVTALTASTDMRPSGCNCSLPEKITMSIIFGLVLVISLNFIICENGEGGLCFLASGLCGLFVIVIILQRHIRGFVYCGEGTAVKRKGKKTAKSTSTTGEPFSRIEKSIPTNELNALHYAQYSVGLISITDSSPDSSPDSTEDIVVTSTGTGFVVGDGHLMTACHVISEQIENILATITQIVLRSEDGVFERWKTRFFGLEEMEPYTAVKGYYEKSKTNLDILISSFEEYVTEEDYLQLKQVLVRKWHDEVTVQFENKNGPVDKYTLSPNIPFLNENIDVAILKIESKPGCKLPESLRLADSDFHHEKVNIFGYIKKIKIELALDPKCEVYTKSSNLEKNVTEAINWWKEQEQEVDNRNEGMYDKIDFEEEYKDCVIKDSEVLLHASPSFVHGTSGSPMIEFKEIGTTTHPVVVGIYLRGYPMFYYKIKKAIENRGILSDDCRHFNKFIELVRENEEAQGMDKIIKMRYFIEGGTTMKHLSDSLPVSDLRDMLFPNRRTEGQRLTLREEESDSGEQFRLSTAAGQLRLQHPVMRPHQSSMGSNIDSVKKLRDKQKENETRLTVLEESTGSPAQLGGAAQTIEDRPCSMVNTVEAWRRENIYITKGVEAVTEKISSKGCVCVIGVPGAGKSTALHHAALSLESEGFTVYLISGPKEFLKYYDSKNSDKKQVFVLDDALGVYSVDQGEVKSWQKQNENVRNALGTNTKLLVSIRTQIFMYETIRDKNIVFLDKSVTTDHVNYSDADYKLGIDDMRGMLTYYMKNKGTDPDNIDKVIKQVWGYTDKELTEMTEVHRQIVMSLYTEYTDKELTEMTECYRQRRMPQYTAGVEFADCFPLLCQVFVTDFSKKPREFFTNPFPALTKVFQNIKTDNKHQFCALVLCAVFDGKLNSDMFNPICVFKYDLDKNDVEIRNDIMTSCNLGEKCLPQIKSALNSLDGVYVTRVENTYKMTHAVFHDVVTYLFNGTDPLFVLRYGTRQFICDRVRLSNTQDVKDPYMIIINDDTNIERLADRLLRDYKSDIETGAEIISLYDDPWTGARFITENPNIHDDRLILCLISKLSDREQTDKKMIDDLFTQCMWTVLHNSDTYKHGDMPSFKLIQLCLQREADCNMYIYDCYPLHMSVETGSLQLIQLLLQYGADKRRVVYGRSVLHCVCSDTSYNRLDLIKLLTQDGDLSVVKFITSDKQTILQILHDRYRYSILHDRYRYSILDDRDRYSILHDRDREIYKSVLDDREILEALDSDSLQVEEVLSDNSIKVLTTDKHQMKHYVKRCKGKLNLVKRLPDNILTYVDRFGCNILHYLADDSKSTSYVLDLMSDTSQAVNQEDWEGRKPYYYVLNKQCPGGMLRKTEKLNDKDREDMIQLYKDNHAIL